MKHRFPVLMLAVASFSIPSPSHAQQSSHSVGWLGIDAHFSVSPTDVDYYNTNGGQTTAASGNSSVLGFSALWTNHSPWSSVIRLALVNTSANWGISGSAEPYFDPERETIEYFEYQYTEQVHLTDLIVDFLERYALDRTNVFLGFTGTFHAASSWRMDRHDASGLMPDSVFYPPQPVPGLRPFTPSITAGVSQDILLSPRLMLTPEFSVTLPLMSMSSTGDWRQTMWRFGTALRYCLNPEK